MPTQTKTKTIIEPEDSTSNFTLFHDRRFYAALVVVGISLLVFYFKSFFVAATVNGMPVLNFELLYRMNQQYREQTLSQMVNEKLILAEAGKQGVVVTPADIDAKIAEIEQSVGGAATFDSLLAQQGQTRDSVKSQLKLQIVIEKLYSSEATVSAEEVAQLLEQGRDNLRATDSAGQEKEATDMLKQQKLSQVFNEKFGKIKNEAKINIF